MPFPDSDVQAALQEWLLLATGLPESNVVWAHEAITPPTGAYLALHPHTLLERLGADEERSTETPGRSEWVGQRRLTVRLSGFGAGAFTLCDQALEALATEPARVAFTGAGLVFLDHTALLDPTPAGESPTVERAQVDVRFTLTSVREETTDWIQSVRGQGSIGNGQTWHQLPLDFNS